MGTGRADVDGADRNKLIIGCDILKLRQVRRAGEAAMHDLINKHAGNAKRGLSSIMVIPMINMKDVEQLRHLVSGCRDHCGPFGDAERGFNGFVCPTSGSEPM